MFGAFARRWLLLAAWVVAWPHAAMGEAGTHRDDVDSTRHPWSAIGKLYNETGASCSAVAIARDKVLTAAHCIFNPRSGQFIAADALHFLAGYRTGKYAAHARVAIYQIGAGFDPQRYTDTADGDWAVLTLTERLPAEIVPMKLSADVAPNGTKAMMAGYPQDRAHALTADNDCELRENIAGARLLLHTCRGIGGYSGAPILVRTAGNELRIAGIQIAKINGGGPPRMLAVPAPAIAGAGFAAVARPAVRVIPMPVMAEACKTPERMELALLVAPPDDALLGAIAAL